MTKATVDLLQLMAHTPLPALETMRDRYLDAQGTPGEQHAADALLVAIVLAQAKILDRASETAMRDPSAALNFLHDKMNNVHESLYWLRTTVFMEAARNDIARSRRKPLTEQAAHAT
jgi:hypothetical protein